VAKTAVSFKFIVTVL